MKSTNRSDYTENHEKAQKGINDLNDAAALLTEVQSKTTESIQLIPQYLGQKDRLGEKVEEYINEILDIIKNAIDVFTDAAGDKSIMENADNCDYQKWQEAVAEAKAAEEKKPETATPAA